MDANNISEPWNYICYINDLALAKIKNTNNNLANEQQSTSIHFAIANLQLYIDNIHINQVIKLPKITPIPNQHKCIKGIASIANKITAVIDLPYLLLKNRAKLSNKSSLILLNTNLPMPIAFIVDEIYDKISLANKNPTKIDETKFDFPKAILEFIGQSYNYQEIVYDFDINKFLASKLFLSIHLAVGNA